MKLYIVTVKWVADVSIMKIRNRPTVYFKSYSECRKFVEMCRAEGHEVAISQDACLDADQAFGHLLNIIENVDSEV